MNTIIFYDTKEYERAFFEKELSQEFYFQFKQNSLLPETKLSVIEENAEVISVFTASRLTKEVITKFKKLKLILTRSVGYSHIDTDFCSQSGIIILNAPHYGDYTVAEFTFGILLNLVRRICFGVNELKQGDMYPETFGMELYGKTLGVVGTGSIGEKMVKIAKGFSMNVICYDVKENLELKNNYYVKYTDLNTLCKLSDIISLHAPLTPSTFHIIDETKIKMMKESVILLNTARGELIDTEALYAALIEKKIKGAALDVLEFEDVLSNKRPAENLNLKNLRISLINSKLLNLSNVVVTPHIAYDTKEAIDRILNITVENLYQFINGKELKNRV